MPKIIGTLMPFTALVDENNSDNVTLAHQFIDWLKNTNQSVWQMLPLNPRPYFAYPDEQEPSPYSNFGIALDPILTYPKADIQVEEYLTLHQDWLPTYALFQSLRDHFKTDEWYTWPHDIRTYQKHAVEIWSQRLATQIQNYYVEQAKLHQAWQTFRDHASQNGIQLIGDLPFYLALKSPLVWKYQTLFEFNEQLKPIFVSGAPASPTFPRQVWGHPLYRYSKIKSLTKLWQLRLSYASTLFHTVRIDHAIGFYTYAAMSFKNSEQDSIRQGPGDKIFQPIIDHAKSLNLGLIAEDLTDFDTQNLRQTLHKNHISGQRVWTMALRDGLPNPYFASVHEYPKNSVSYTSTHDTPTLMGFIKSLTDEQWSTLVTNNLKLGNSERKCSNIRNQILQSPSEMSIIPIQDWLLIEERINNPGQASEWQLKVEISLLT